MTQNNNLIAGAVLVKEQQDLLAKCLDSIKWCDQLIVIDDNSKDKSASIAKDYQAEVFTRSLEGDFSSQRNFAISKSKCTWTLFIDADEIVSSSLKKEILTKLEDSQYTAYRLKRRDLFLNKIIKYGDPGSFREIRLAHTNSGKFVNKVHEIWQVSGPVGIINHPIDHIPHKNIDQMITKLNFYSTLRAKQLFESKKNSSPRQIILYPLGKFIQNYLWRRGFFDGSIGFVHAILMSFYSYLVRSKLYLLNRNSHAETH